MNSKKAPFETRTVMDARKSMRIFRLFATPRRKFLLIGQGYGEPRDHPRECTLPRARNRMAVAAALRIDPSIEGSYFKAWKFAIDNPPSAEGQIDLQSAPD